MDESAKSKQERLQDIKKNRTIFSSIADLFSTKIENNKELHNKIADDVNQKLQKERDRQDKIEERKSKLSEMTKNVFKNTKLGKKYQSVSNFIQNKKDKVQDLTENVKNKAIAGTVNAIGAIGGSDVKIDVQDLYNKEDDNKEDTAPTSTDSTDSADSTSTSLKDKTEENSIKIDTIINDVKDVKDVITNTNNTNNTNSTHNTNNTNSNVKYKDESINSTTSTLDVSQVPGVDIVPPVSAGDTSSTSSVSNSNYKLGDLIDSQKILKDDLINDNSDIEKVFKDSHKETIKEIKKIEDTIYDFTHKQDTSISKKQTKTSGDKCGLAYTTKKEDEPESSSGSFLSDFFSKSKNNTKGNKGNKGNKSNKTKTIKNKPSKLSKILEKGSKSKLSGVKTLSKGISKTINATKSGIQGVKNTGLAAKTAGSNAIKSVGKVTGLSKAVSATKNASSAVKGISKTGLRAISKKIPGLATVATVGLGAYDYATADDDKGRKDALGGTAGGVAGAWAGGEAGAALGLAFGPGAVVMSPLLGLIGAVGGGILGSSYGKEITDFLFSDIDDSIPDEQKQNPFSFNAALENMRPSLVEELQNTKDKDKREDIIDKINELNDKEKEVTSRDSLKSWLEDEIEEDKKSPKLKDKSEEDIAKALITSEKIPTEYRAELVDIYNKDIVGGFFSSDGDLKLSSAELGIIKEPKNQNKGDKAPKKIVDSKVSNDTDKPSVSPLAATSALDKNANTNSSIASNVVSNPIVKSLPVIGPISSIVDLFSSDNTNSNSNSNTNNTRFSKDKFLSNELKNINNASIKTKDTSSNMNISNITKQLINSSNGEQTSEPQVIKETLQPIIQQQLVPSDGGSDNTVSMSSFGSNSQDVIASEIIGGV